MATSLLRRLSAAALAALLPLAVGCDGADPDPGRPQPPGDPAVPVEVNTDSLQAVFACDVAVLDLDAEADGAFGDAPCRLGDGRPVAFYAFGVDEDADALVVEAGSAWFDTVLRLYDEDGGLLAENDDTDWFDTNSRLESGLERGVYVAAVTAFDTTAAGPYRVAASR